MAGTYVVTACVAGTSSIAGSDRAVAPCTGSITGYYVSQACRATNDGSTTARGTDTQLTVCSVPLSGQYTTRYSFLVFVPNVTPINSNPSPPPSSHLSHEVFVFQVPTVV
jgi:hypothetical protein